MKQRAVLAVLLSFCTLAPVLGQTKPTADNDDVVRITSNLVQLDVIVTKDGKPVTNLNAADFEIYEDGKRQNITNFAFISNVSPRDRSSSAPDKADDAKATVPDAPPGPVKLDVPRRTIAVVVDDLGLSHESAKSMKIGSAGQVVAIPDLKKKRLALSGVVLRDDPSAASQSAVMAAPATRRLHVNSDLRFAFVLYNATGNNAASNLVMQAKLVRDGKIVKTGPQTPIEVAKQTELDRLFVTSALPLSADLEPGSYYLQVVVTGKTAKDKQPPSHSGSTSRS